MMLDSYAYSVKDELIYENNYKIRKRAEVNKQKVLEVIYQHTLPTKQPE